MAARGGAQEVISALLAQRGPQAVPYEERHKWTIRQHLSELLKVRTGVAAARAGGSCCCMQRGRPSPALPGLDSCLHPLQPRTYSICRSLALPAAAAAARSHHAQLLPTASLLLLRAQMFPNLTIKVSEFHTNDGR